MGSTSLVPQTALHTEVFQVDYLHAEWPKANYLTTGIFSFTFKLEICLKKKKKKRKDPRIQVDDVLLDKKYRDMLERKKKYPSLPLLSEPLGLERWWGYPGTYVGIFAYHPGDISLPDSVEFYGAWVASGRYSRVIQVWHSGRNLDTP